MIKFENITIQHFNSIGIIENFDFNPGVHAVKGLNLDEEKSKSNGAGKSSMFDAITWVLYGVTPNGKKGDKVVNRVYGGNCFVKLNFSIGDMSYRIERYRRHDSENDNIKVFINEQDKTIHPPSKNQETIDNIIQVPFNLFTSSFVVAQGLNGRFTALTDFQRKETIENIRKSHVWDTSREIAKKKLKDLESKINELTIEVGKKEELDESYQQQLRDIKQSIKNLKEEKKNAKTSDERETLGEEKVTYEDVIEELNGFIKRYEATESDLRKAIRTLNETLSDIPDKIDALRTKNSEYNQISELTALKSEKEQIEKQIEGVKSEQGLGEKQNLVAELREKISNNETEKVALQKSLQKTLDTKNKVSTDLTAMTSESVTLKEHLQFYIRVLDPEHESEECPTCGSIPGEGSLDEIKSKKDETEKKLQDVLDAKSKKTEAQATLEAKIQKYNDLVAELSTESAEITKKIDPIEDEIHKIQQEISQLTGQIQSVDKKISLVIGKMETMGISEEDIPKLSDEITQNLSKIEKLTEERDDLREKVADKESEMDRISNKLTSFREKKSKNQTSLSEVVDKISTIDRKIESIETQLLVKMDDMESVIAKREEVIQQKSTLLDDRRFYEEELPVYKSLDKIFSPKGIRAHIISKDIGYLNQRLDYYSKHFFSDMYVQLDPGIDDEGNVTKIDIPVSTTMNWEKEYEDCSGGEKRRIDICIQLAIFDLILSISSVTTNLLVLDEVFEGLDSEGVKAVMECVKSISAHGGSIFVISHLPNLGEFVDDEVVFVKEGGVTTISIEFDHVAA